MWSNSPSTPPNRGDAPAGNAVGVVAPAASLKPAGTKERFPTNIAERYRRSQVLGLVLIAAVILLATLLRADMRTLFPPGWWRF